MKVIREENESLLEYYDRLMKNRKELDLDYIELEEIILGETPYCSENVRKGIYFFEKVIEKLLEEELRIKTKIAKIEYQITKEKENQVYIISISKCKHI